MSGFGDRFNQWLVDRGEEPVPDEVAQALNEAGRAIADWLRENQADIATQIHSAMVALSGSIEEMED